MDYVPVGVMPHSVYSDTGVDWFSSIFLRASEERMRHLPRVTKPLDRRYKDRSILANGFI